MKASVVIRAKNEARTLGAVLDGVFAQRFDEFEVVVVDSGSTDDTVAIAESKGARVVRIAPEAFTYGRALNLGARESTGEIVVFLSGHAVPFDRAWLAEVAAPFANPEVAAVAGRHVPHLDCNPFDARGLRRRFRDDAGPVPTPSGINYTNGNGAVRRTEWEAHPFDEALPYSEDLEWQERVRRAGRRVVYAPCAAVRHSHNEPGRVVGKRTYDQVRARRALGMYAGPSTASGLLADWVAGSAYDKLAALRSDRRLVWLVRAPLRRAWINAARYLAHRSMDWTDRPGRAIAQRAAVRALMRANDLCGRAVPHVMRWTGRSREGLHPKHVYGVVDQFWERGELTPGARVLDLGCNRGAHALEAAAAVEPGGSVVGIDSDEIALQAARSRARRLGRPNVEFRAGDLEKPLDAEDGSFDAVLALDVIEHLHADGPFAAEIARVLRPGGIALVAAPNAETSWKRLRRRLGLPHLSDPDHKREYDCASLAAVVESAGLVVRRTDPVVFDSAVGGIADLVGALVPPFYRWWVRRKRALALRRPADSTGWRLVAERPA